MAYTFELNTQKSISFEDFIDFVDRTIDPENPQTLIDCTEKLQMLSNNEEFLLNIIHQELDNLETFQKNNYHSSQSLMIHRGKENKYYIRLNIWPPLSPRKDIREWQENLYFYLRAHDHNFNFLTVGYFGGGYETEIWEYDYDSVSGVIGEKVEMHHLETTKLQKGKVMFYRASKDIHSQLASEDYSLSLNILPINLQGLRREQFYFDLKSCTITGVTANGATGRYLITNLAGIYGNSETVKKLEELAFTHEVPFVRLKSYDALANLTNNHKCVWEKATLDKSKIVSANAIQILNNEKRAMTQEEKEKKYYLGFNSAKL